MTLDKDDGDDLIDPAGRVGEAGESFFQILANSGGGVANKVSRDRLGWDFHLQLQRTSDWRVRHSLDTRPPEASCFVQVKASSHRSLSFTWTEDDALPELTGRELVKAIQRHVGPDVGDYEVKKAQLVKDLGYSDGRLKYRSRSTTMRRTRRWLPWPLAFGAICRLKSHASLRRGLVSRSPPWAVRASAAPRSAFQT